MASVALQDIWKVYDDGTVAVSGVSLDIADSEFMVLVGPSGCGKTTLLRMVAGLDDATGGDIRVGDRRVNDVPPRDRDLAMVFQNYALYPHLTVRENIGFGLKLRKVDKAEIDRRVSDVAATLGLADHLDRKPRQLSGGQRQRVAMGRAIVRQPAAFLMDEPLSNLDAKLRVQVRAEIARLQRDLSVTTIYVTHDQVEAMTMADRVAVMRKGTIQQVASPQELYEQPVNIFVGAFIGSPAMNLVEAEVRADGDRLSVSVGDQVLALDDALVAARPALRAHVGARVALGIRPEDLEDAALVPDHPADRRLKARVTLTEALGSDVYVHTDMAAVAVSTEDVREVSADLGLGDGGTGPATAEVVARCGPATGAAMGQTVELAVDTARVHVFDLATGLSITT